MSQPAIQVEGLSKLYRIRHGDRANYRTLREEIMHGLSWPLRKLRGEKSETAEDFWALKDVSFEVQPGEVVGVIGRNGAGKSTLLKVLSRITKPTAGRVRMNGRIGSLLEVGTGFHPELSGRENIFLSGAMLGMKRAEIARKFDEIVAFAEIDKFLETPVKRYSSGMYVRLGFAIAAHLEPEILIVDEVLAVGDAQFQKKCLGKMGESARSGRTVLFVSHNMAAVKSLCGRSILLLQGKMQCAGETSQIVRNYLAVGEGDSTSQNLREWDLAEAPGNDRIRLLRVAIQPASGYLLDIGAGIDIELDVECRETIFHLDATIELRNLDDVLILHDGMVFTDDDAERGCYRVKLTIPPFVLNAGVYRLSVFFGQHQRYLVWHHIDVLKFTIEHDAATGTLGARPGIVRVRLGRFSEKLSDLPAAKETDLQASIR